MLLVDENGPAALLNPEGRVRGPENAEAAAACGVVREGGAGGVLIAEEGAGERAA